MPHLRKPKPSPLSQTSPLLKETQQTQHPSSKPTSRYMAYSVSQPSRTKKITEEKQAFGLVDESIKNNVEHFVFTSVDRGGPGVSEKNPTDIPHFLAKHKIEEYLKDQIKAKGSKMQYTILRPVAFMDNLTNDFMGKGFASMWGGVGSKPLQLISTRDIGLFSARAFQHPAQYKNKAVSLAGDELNLTQAKKVFKDTLGYDMPETWGFVGSGLKWMISELGTMFKWFADQGYGADIASLKKEEPKLQNFSEWLAETSTFKKQ
ncbi:hypothetical protein G7Y89_g773 [Cudoniella acicularis]|uniref:NmrA-like domain-containing protein n=1 Tax=Cudoniella acicularis TaxID=354080 RepID=A0A8H4RZC7_9HELO|nr:hypothetical protein G7Y89_g773 [Cudoniella acicularis]